MNHSTNIDQIATALNKFQHDVAAVPLNATIPFLHNRYADLGACIEAAREHLFNNGLAVSQLVTNDGPQVGIETVLMHASGQWMSSTVTLFIGDEKGKSY